VKISRITDLTQVMRPGKESLRQDSAGVSSYNHILVARFDNVPYVVG